MLCTDDKTERFESVQEFLDHIERGDEIEFLYRDNRYWIVRDELGHTLYRVGDDDDCHSFATPMEVLEFLFQKENMRETIVNLPITHSLFC